MTLQSFFGTFNIWQVISSFVFLIAIIDPVGNMPITINMEKSGSTIHPNRVCIYSIVILIAFLVCGDLVLKIFGIRPEYFAIAGGFVILLMALEMLLDVTYFKYTELGTSGDLVPLAFPMYAGPGAFTALLSLTTDYSIINLLIAINICMLVLYLVLKGTHWLSQYLKPVSLYIIRKFFGVIVLAMSVQLVFANLVKVFHPDEDKPTAPIISSVTPTTHDLTLGDNTTIRTAPWF